MECYCTVHFSTFWWIKGPSTSGGTDSSERGWVPSRKTDRLHDLRLLSSHWCSRLQFLIMLIRSITLRNVVQEFDSRWDEIVMINDQDPTGRYSGKLVQIENTWVWSTQNRVRIVRHGNSSEEIKAWLSEVENHGEEKHRSETSISKFLMPEVRELRQRKWLRLAGG